MSELHVNLGGLHFLGDWGDSDSVIEWLDIKDTLGSVLGSLLQLFGSSVVDHTLLGLTLNSWEKNELALVLIKSLDVLGLIISVFVVSSVINSNTNGLGEFTGKASFL